MIKAIAMLLAICLLPAGLAQGSDGPSGQPSHGSATTPESPREAVDSRTFGTASTVARTIGAYAFEASSSLASYAAFVGTGDRYLTSPIGVFVAAINIPAGARILSIDVQGCDGSGAGELKARLFSNTTTSGVQSETDHGGVSTGGVAAPGCGFFSANFASPVTVDNQHRTYYVQVEHGTVTDGTIRFSAVRLYYQLQVSPAPAVASFDDVPTGHPFFSVIEALVAAGITTGCSAAPPLYCPDGVVTRKQMAAFIARALGLHFAP